MDGTEHHTNSTEIRYLCGASQDAHALMPSVVRMLLCTGLRCGRYSLRAVIAHGQRRPMPPNELADRAACWLRLLELGCHCVVDEDVFAALVARHSGLAHALKTELSNTGRLR